MIRAFNGKMPKTAGSAFVSEWAYVVGDVEIGENSGIWPGAVIRGDFGSIRIGRDCQIEDNSVVHSGTTVEIGDQVIIGHGAVIHGLKIGNNVLIGNNATILDLAEIGDNCVIAANSMVATEQKIPSNSLVMGVPAKIKRELSLDDMAKTRRRITERYDQMVRANEMRSYPDLVKKYKEEGL
jgi:carbonic anhydrase/acetyltransferase-like protein (isoleucine patch superfamily)